MHIEILVEDSSGERLLQVLMPQLLGPQGEPHTWRFHAYKGVGRIPKGLATKTDPAKRILLDRLPKMLRGYGKTPGIDAVVVVVDTDKRDCAAFLAELKAVAVACGTVPKYQASTSSIASLNNVLTGPQATATAFSSAKNAAQSRLSVSTTTTTASIPGVLP